MGNMRPTVEQAQSACFRTVEYGKEIERRLNFNLIGVRYYSVVQ